MKKENEYPSKEDLDYIRKFDITQAPIEDLRDFVFSIWHWGDSFYKSNGRFFELHTGGWSGNEAIVDALTKASRGVFWMVCWRMSKRGGHYYFEIPPKLTKQYRMKREGSIK